MRPGWHSDIGVRQTRRRSGADLRTTRSSRSDRPSLGRLRPASRITPPFGAVLADYHRQAWGVVRIRIWVIWIRIRVVRRANHHSRSPVSPASASPAPTRAVVPAGMPAATAMPATATVPATASTPVLSNRGRSGSKQHSKAQSCKKYGTMFHFEPPASRLIVGV
jgi:hypothetical protein